MKKMIIITLFVTFLAVNAKRQQRTLSREELISSMLDPNLWSNMTRLPKSKVAKNDVQFYLYNKERPNNPIKLIPGSIKDRNTSIINVSRKFKVILHGWTGDGNLEWIRNMKDQYLKKGKYNIIIVDWSKPAATWIYPIAISNVNSVAKYISEFLIRLHKTYRISYQNFHLIGHSLGAHVAGSAGKYLTKKEGRKYKRITGLDPAGPLFRSANQHIRLSYEDANLVDVIHTDGLLLGYHGRLGHVDFYVNRGFGIQPGCKITDFCSHYRSHEYFTESINSMGFIAKECSTFLKYCTGLCNFNKEAIMGENLNSNTSGIYYLNTNSEPPFARYGQ